MASTGIVTPHSTNHHDAPSGIDFATAASPTTPASPGFITLRNTGSGRSKTLLPGVHVSSSPVTVTGGTQQQSPTVVVVCASASSDGVSAASPPALSSPSSAAQQSTSGGGGGASSSSPQSLTEPSPVVSAPTPSTFSPTSSLVYASDASAGWNGTLFVVLALHLASGCGYTMSIVWQDHLVLRTSPSTRTFFVHPFIQTYFILLGQAVNLPIALAVRWVKWSSRVRDSVAAASRSARSSNDSSSPQMAFDENVDAAASSSNRLRESKRLRRVMLILLLTAVMETSETTLCVFALSLMDASVFAMLRIIQLVFATSLQLYVLPWLRYGRHGALQWWRERQSSENGGANSTGSGGGRTTDTANGVEASPGPFYPVHFTRTQMFGLYSVVLGVLIVYYSAQQEAHTGGGEDSGNRHYTTASTALGCIFVVLAMMILSVQTATHEYVLRNYNDVIEPMELIGFQGIACTVCSVLMVILINSPIVGMRDDVVEFLVQLSDGWMAPMSVISVVLCTTLVDATGTYLTKMMSANVRPALQPMRSGLIWMVGLLTNTSSFSFLRLLGFIVSASGAMVFKKMITPPAWLSCDPPRRAATGS